MRCAGHSLDEAAPLCEFGDRTQAIRVEDMGDVAVLTAVCKWLGIDYHPCLQESTWAGLRWWGDRLSARAVPARERGFSKTINTNNWAFRLGGLDGYVLRHLLCQPLDRYGYEPMPTSQRIAKLTLPLFMLLPTTFEREYLIAHVRSGRYSGVFLRAALALAFHYVKRVGYFYSLYRRNLFGRHLLLDHIRPLKLHDEQ